MSGPAPIKLHLGCGRGRIEDWVNCDLYPAPNVDCTFDVQKDWPFGDNAAACIYSSHMLEHLTDPHAFFREAWRVLQPNGQMVLRLPHGDHRSAWWDLTHIRPWLPETFVFLQPGHAERTGNPQHLSWQWPFGIDHVNQRISAKFAPYMRWPLKKWLLYFGENIAGLPEELWVHLYTLKTPAAVAEYRRTHDPCSVFTVWSMYQHHAEGRADLREGEAPKLVRLDEDEVHAGMHSWRLRKDLKGGP